MDVHMPGLAMNTPLIAALARQLTDYPGVTVMVTNPLYICARLFAELSGCPACWGSRQPPTPPATASPSPASSTCPRTPYAAT
ncbi:hypothetical protein ACFTUC_39115 [Streptomyces sp. NPDC056944]|uniref:hypothetical protein n=1 Tax=unclassified Streptomyces TaxID=2593676 RepID=UPI0036269B9A